VHPAYIPNDPLLSQEWHLARIASPLAWDRGNGGGVVVAVLDTGCGTVPDLSRVVAGWNLYDGNFNTTDVYGHGTLTAGAALAVGDNLVGVCGVGYGSTLMAVRVSAVDGTATYGRAALGIRFAVDHGAKVVNLSYQMSESLAVQDAAKYANERGVVVCIASGNGGTTSTVPNSPNILTVGSTNSSDTKSSFSVRGSIVDLYAPGESILTTERSGTYGFHSGTSFSSPIVAGVAALCFSVHPAWTAYECMDVITSSCDIINGVKRVNAARAVNTVVEHIQDTPDTIPPTVTILEPANNSLVSKPFPVIVDAQDDRGVAKVDLYLDGILAETKTTTPFNFTVNPRRWSKGPHSITVRASDSSGNLAASAITVVR